MRLGIIGCGTIAATYVQALGHLNDAFSVTALYDVCPEKAESLGVSGAAVCPTLEALLQRQDVDCVVISTPLSTHVAVAEACLRGKKHVLLEKPAALSVAEIQRLFELAQEQGVAFHVSFHSSFGVDIEWYLENLGRVDPVFRKENIRTMECHFYDPYVTDGVMLEDRKPLGGSYIDSGVNILSVCSRLVPMEGMTLRQHTTRKTGDGVVYGSETVLEDGCVRIRLHTGWDKDLNHKSTLLGFADTEEAILLDHTGQSVWKLGANNEKQLLYQENVLQRMVNQYIIVFRAFAKALESKGDPLHCQQVVRIHELLLSVGEDGIGRQ